MCYIANHPNVMFDKLKITDMRNTYDIWRKYCCLQMVNVSIGSAPVGVEQLSDQHIQKMAPQMSEEENCFVQEEGCCKEVATKENCSKEEANQPERFGRRQGVH